jgi:hypothetical protein
MVHFILTRKGYEQLVARLGRTPSPVWFGYGVIDDTERDALAKAGVDVSTFTTPFSRSDGSEFEDALHTIEEHHPGDTVWVEPSPES